MKKYFRFWVLGFFVVDIINVVGLGLFSRGYGALGPNCKVEVLRSSFYWKLG